MLFISAHIDLKSVSIPYSYCVYAKTPMYMHQSSHIGFNLVVLLHQGRGTSLKMMLAEYAVMGVVVSVLLFSCGWIAKRFNSFLHKPKKYANKKIQAPLPPGEFGLPIVGNMLSFLRAFKSSNPESFISQYVTRYGRVGVYKAFMFGKPTVLATTPEVCKAVLMDETEFTVGWPKSCCYLIGRKSFACLSNEEHRRLRKFTSAPVTSLHALTSYLPTIQNTVLSTLDHCAVSSTPTCLLPLLRKMTFTVIGYIFLRNESEETIAAMEREYGTLNLGVRAMAINLPGTAYSKAIKARRNLVDILQSVIDRRRKALASGDMDRNKEDGDMLEQLLMVRDEDERFLTDEEIIDLLVMYLNAGHESTAHIIMWSVVLLLKHPNVFHKCKEEQEHIVKNRSKVQGQDTLSFGEFREMHYLRKVIDEVLRIVNISPMVFREALNDVQINGYLIPRGWKTQVWLRNVHLDPQVYPDPKRFNPDRWNDIVPKPGTFLPFGGGSRMCPGNELAKMEISTFLHHILLHYEVELVAPDSKVKYLPHPRPVDNCPVRVTKKKISPKFEDHEK